MRAGLLLLVVGGLLGAATAEAGRAGEGPSYLQSAASVLPPHRLTLVAWPDTSRKVLRPDSVVVAPVAVLQPDEDDKLTRKTSLRIVVAIALLTVTTLLLYNVRSR